MAVIKRKDPVKLTVDRIQYHISNYFYTRYDQMVPNAFIRDIELDFVGVRKSGFVDEFEIKLSRSDFRADFKKTCLVSGEYINKHVAILNGHLTTNYFYFVVPKGMISIEEIPAVYGLIEIDESGLVRTVREPKRLHDRKITDKLRFKLAMKLAYRWWDNFRAEQKKKPA